MLGGGQDGCPPAGPCPGTALLVCTGARGLLGYLQGTFTRGLDSHGCLSSGALSHSCAVNPVRSSWAGKEHLGEKPISCVFKFPENDHKTNFPASWQGVEKGTNKRKPLPFGCEELKESPPGCLCPVTSAAAPLPSPPFHSALPTIF